MAAAGEVQSVHESAGTDDKERKEVQVDVKIGEISEALELKLRVSSEQKTKLKDGKARASADHGEARHQPEGTRTFLEAREDFPWLLRRFGDEPSNGNDVWDEALWESYGWLVRVHKKGRVRPFHPLHRTTPRGGKELSGHRVTVFFQGKKQVGVHQDDWHFYSNFHRFWLITRDESPITLRPPPLVNYKNSSRAAYSTMKINVLPLYGFFALANTFSVSKRLFWIRPFLLDPRKAPVIAYT